MSVVTVELPAVGPRSYEIVVGRDLPVGVAEDLLQFADPPAWAVVTDEIVGSLYGRSLTRALRSLGAEASCFTFPEGEGSKTRATAARLQDEIIAAGYGRDAWLVAVGGGVAGDLGGFVAATLYRGVPHVQVPTTLLAMVDSSIGGKTGVDTDAGKNLVGAFWQPRRVLVDVTALDSLPAAEMAAGMAEVIKYGVILDEELFVELEEGLLAAALAHGRPELERIVARCCELKAEVVAADETEADYRQILNFGHTVGHAVETVHSFRMRHGEAVAVGMVAEARLASRLVGAPDGLADRIAALCRAAGLPVAIPDGCVARDLVAAMRRDKKARGGHIRCALPVAIGRVHSGPEGHSVAVDPEVLATVL